LWEREGAVFGLLQEKGGGGLCWMVRECRERGLHGQMERRWGGVVTCQAGTIQRVLVPENCTLIFSDWLGSCFSCVIEFIMVCFTE